jgi:hypothetical protein
MTVQEMHYAVDQGLQKVGSSVYDSFLSDEIDFWLNRAQDRFIKQRLHPITDPKRLGFSKTIKRLDDLRMILSVDYTDGIIPSTAVAFQNFDLPVDYRFLVNARVSMHYNPCGNQVSTSDPEVIRDLRIVEQDKAYTMQGSPFSKSTGENPMGFIFDENIRVFQDGKSFILKTIYLDYLRIPTQINLSLLQDCELAEHTHQEIVDMTVRNMVEAIESPRYQTNSIEQSQSE